ncbi:ATP-dependent helicase/deoxyribonuclease subunit B [Bienertia sinuspersici]
MASSITHFRSSSYPPKSNPIIQKIEEELKKLRKSEASSSSITETIYIGLKGLARLYRCIDDMLKMPLLSQKTLSLNLSKHGNFLIEGSSKLLEICISSKHILEKFLLECCSCSNNEIKVSRYFALRKEMMKGAKSLALQLRQVEGSFYESTRNDNNNEVVNEDFEVIRVLKCVSIINISVLESLLRFLGMPLKSSSKFGLFSKLVIKKSKSVISEENLPKCGNELSNVDVVLHSFDVERFEINDFAKKRLEVLEAALRGIDDGLSNIIKQLNKTRASLMSIISV